MIPILEHQHFYFSHRLIDPTLRSNTLQGVDFPVLLFLGLFEKYQGKPPKTTRISLTFRILKNLGEEAENTPKDQGISQREKHQGKKNTKEKKDRVWVDSWSMFGQFRSKMTKTDRKPTQN